MYHIPYIFILSVIEISKSLTLSSFLMLKKCFELTGLHYLSRGLHKKNKTVTHILKPEDTLKSDTF